MVSQKETFPTTYWRMELTLGYASHNITILCSFRSLSLFENCIYVQMSEFAQTDQALYAHFMNGNHVAQRSGRFYRASIQAQNEEGSYGFCLCPSAHHAEVNRAMQNFTSSNFRLVNGRRILKRTESKDFIPGLDLGLGPGP